MINGGPSAASSGDIPVDEFVPRVSTDPHGCSANFQGSPEIPLNFSRGPDDFPAGFPMIFRDF